MAQGVKKGLQRQPTTIEAPDAGRGAGQAPQQSRSGTPEGELDAMTTLGRMSSISHNAPELFSDGPAGWSGMINFEVEEAIAEVDPARLIPDPPKRKRKRRLRLPGDDVLMDLDPDTVLPKHIRDMAEKAAAGGSQSYSQLRSAPLIRGHMPFLHKWSRRLQGADFGKEDLPFGLGLVQWLSPAANMVRRNDIAEARIRLNPGTRAAYFEKMSDNDLSLMAYNTPIQSSMDFTREAAIRAIMSHDQRVYQGLTGFEENVKLGGTLQDGTRVHEDKFASTTATGALEMIPYMVQIAARYVAAPAEFETLRQEKLSGEIFIDSSGEIHMTKQGQGQVESFIKAAIQAPLTIAIERQSGAALQKAMTKMSPKGAALMQLIAEAIENKVPIYKALGRINRIAGFDSLPQEIFIEEGLEAIAGAVFNYEGMIYENGMRMDLVDRLAENIGIFADAIPDMAAQMLLLRGGQYALGPGSLGAAKIRRDKLLKKAYERGMIEQGVAVQHQIAIQRAERNRQREQLRRIGLADPEIDAYFSKAELEHDPLRRREILRSSVYGSTSAGVKAAGTGSALKLIQSRRGNLVRPRRILDRLLDEMVAAGARHAKERTQSVIIPGTEEITERTGENLGELARLMGIPPGQIAKLPKEQQIALLNSPELQQAYSAAFLTERARQDEIGETGSGPAPATAAPLDQPSAAAPEDTPPPVAAPLISVADSAASFKVKSPKDRKKVVRGRWAIVDISQLSGGEGLQERDRDRKVSEQQIADNFQQFDADEMLDSTTSAQGAIIVNDQGQIIAGYGRKRMLEMLYDTDDDRQEDYRSLLGDYEDQYGLEGQQKGKARPVLVRVALEYENTDQQDFAADSNFRQVLGFSPAENALRDARMIVDLRLESLLPPINNESTPAQAERIPNSFARGFIDAIGSTEAADLVDRSGAITPAGENRMRTAILATLLIDHPAARELVTQVVESAADYGIKPMINGLTGSASILTTLKHARPDFDLSPEIAEALTVLMDVKRQLLHGKFNTVDDYFNAPDMFAGATPEIEGMVRIFLGAKSAKQMAAILFDYAEAALAMDQATQDLFAGNLPESQKIDLLEQVMKRGGIIREKSKTDTTEPDSPPPADQGQPDISGEGEAVSQVQVSEDELAALEKSYSGKDLSKDEIRAPVKLLDGDLYVASGVRSLSGRFGGKVIRAHKVNRVSIEEYDQKGGLNSLHGPRRDYAQIRAEWDAGTRERGDEAGHQVTHKGQTFILGFTFEFSTEAPAAPAAAASATEEQAPPPPQASTPAAPSAATPPDVGIEDKFYSQENDSALDDLDDLLKSPQESYDPGGDGLLHGEGGSLTAIRQTLVNAAAVKIEGKSSMDALATRQIVAKARSLLRALDQGRIDDEQAQARWDKELKSTGRLLKADTERKFAQGSGSQLDLLGGDADQPTLFEPSEPLEPGPAPMQQEELIGWASKHSATSDDTKGIHEQLKFAEGLAGEPDYHTEAFGAFSMAMDAPAHESDETTAQFADEQSGADLRKGLEQEGGVSSLVHRHLKDELPSWDIEGALVNGPKDFALLNMSLRHPRMESTRVAVVHRETGRVVGARVISIGNVAATVLSGPRLINVFNDFVGSQNPADFAMWLSHNHPSGNPEPTFEDFQTTRIMQDYIESAGIHYGDHIITNGDSYYSVSDTAIAKFDRADVHALEAPGWDRFFHSADVDARPAIKGQRSFDRLRLLLGKADENMLHVVLVDTRNRIREVQRLPMGQDANQILAHVTRQAARSGSTGVFIISGRSLTKQEKLGIKRLQDQRDMTLLDVSTPETLSWRKSLFTFWKVASTSPTLQLHEGDGSPNTGKIVDTAAKAIASSFRNQPFTVEDVRGKLSSRYGDKIEPYIQQIWERATDMIRTGEIDMLIALNQKGAVTDAETTTPQQTEDGAGSKPTDPRAARGGGPERRTDLRMVGAADLPEPSPHVGVGAYDVDDDQRLGINLALDRFLNGGKGFLLGDGAGVGKTSQILVVAKEYKERFGEDVLIIGLNELSFKGSFLDDAERLGLNLNDFDVATFASMSRRGGGQKLTRIERGKKPERVLIGEKHYGLVIIDEAHRLKNTDTATSIEGMGFIDRSDHVMFATATPMDTVTAAHYFLSELTGIDKDRMAAMLGFKITRKRHPDSGKMYDQAVLLPNSSWANVLENIMQLRAVAVRQGAYLRREYPFKGSLHSISYDFPAPVMEEHSKIFNYWTQMAERGLMPARTANGQKTLTIRNWSESHKIDKLMEDIKVSLSSGRKVIVVADFVTNSVRMDRPEPFPEDENPDRTILKAELWDEIFGGTPPEIRGTLSVVTQLLEAEGISHASIYGKHKKDKEQDKFQKGDAKVLIMTAKSGGTSINLDDVFGDEPRDMYIMSTEFAGDNFQQVMGRISRRNTASESRVLFYYANRVFSDDRSREIVDRKLQVLERIQAGEDLDETSIDIAPEVHMLPATPAAEERMNAPEQEQEGPYDEELDQEMEANDLRGIDDLTNIGGPLGEPFDPNAPRPLEDDNRATQIVIELPEMVALARDLLKGKYPRAVKKLGDALGMFRHRGEEGELFVRQDMFELIQPEEKAELRRQAEVIAEQMAAEQGIEDVTELEDEVYQELYESALEEAKEGNPLMASKVLAHEIGHVVDWLPDHLVKGRNSNILGRIASLNDYTKKMMADHPNSSEELISPADRKEMRKAAGKEARATVGPPPAGATSGQRAAIRKRKEELTKTLYHQKIEEERKKRGLITADEIVKELSGAIAWWHGTDTIPNYFTTSVEMYADTMSILLNNPTALMKRAPKFHAAWFAYLDENPEVARLYSSIVDGIMAGTARTEIVEGLRKSFRANDEKGIAIAEAAGKKSGKEKWHTILYSVDRTFGPMYSRMRRAPDQEHTGPARKAIGDYLYKAVEHELFLGQVNQVVMTHLVENGLDWVDLAEYMFHQHVIYNRTERTDGIGVDSTIASPMGFNVKGSTERLEEWEQMLGPDKWGQLKAAQTKFRELYDEHVVTLLRESEVLGDDLMAVIEDRVFYSTFKVVQGEIPARSDSIEAALNERFGSGVGSHIYKQHGWLGEVGNPATATAQKALSLISMAHREMAKREVIKYLLETDDALVEPAKTRWTGRRREIVIRDDPQSRVGTIIFLHKGKAHGFYVEQSLANAFKYGSAVENRIITQAARYLNDPVKSLYTRMNLGFWPVAWFRDVRAFVNHMPGAHLFDVFHFGRRGYARYLARGFKAARSSVKGKPNEAAQLAMSRKMVISRSEPIGQGMEADPFEKELLRYNQTPESWRLHTKKPMAALESWMRKWMHIGEVLERSHKMMGMLYLDENYPDVPEWKKRDMVREYAGSPDFLQKSGHNTIWDMIQLFYNARKEGYRSSLKSFGERPAERTWKFAKYTALPMATMYALKNGLLAAVIGQAASDDLEDKYNSISEYDMRNYQAIPLFWVDKEQMKVAYLRLPLEENESVLHNVLWNVADGYSADGWQSLTSFASGQLPTGNPFFKVSLAWSLYWLGGKMPYDQFYGRTVMTQQVADARDHRAVRAMGRHIWNNMGGGIIHRMKYDVLDDPDPSDLEKVLDLPIVSNLLGRWIKVSNRGIRDRARGATRPVIRQEARDILDTRELAAEFLDSDFSHELTEEEIALLVSDPSRVRQLKKQLKTSWMSRQDPKIRAVLDARTTKQREAVIRELMTE